MKKEELTKLIERAMNGDPGAFERVMQEKAKQIAYIATSLMKNTTDGEDAAQEAMLRMYQHLDELKDPQAFPTWMYRIVTRTCIDQKRKLIRHDHEYLEQENGLKEMRREFLPQDYIEDVDKREFLMSVINDLPDNYRTGLLLFYYEDMTRRQIAEVMGVSEKTVENILQRGRKRIKSKLEMRYGENLKLLSLKAGMVPVLGQVFQLDADMRISGDMLGRLLEGVSGTMAVGVATAAGTTSASGATAAGTTGAATASTGGTVTGGSSAASAVSGAATTSATGGLSVTAKMVTGVAVAVTVAGGSTMAFWPGSEEAFVPKDEPAAVEEQQIFTLEDMIGQEAADQLRAYTQGDEDPAAWADFLTGLAAQSISGIVIDNIKYTLYRLEKQDKQLLILGARQAEQLEVAFLFTDRETAPPTERELLESLEVWRQ